MKVCIDFDGTITEQIPYKPYDYGKPKKDIVAQMQKIRYNVSNKIIIWTSRSWVEA